MVTGPAIGFIGFGEAGFHMARGLRSAGAARIHAYYINTYTPLLRGKIQGRAAASEVCLLASSAGIADASDILFSAVTVDRAMEAAEQSAPFLKPRHIYVDINSVSPVRKQSIAGVVTDAGARFVEAAV